MVVVEVEGQSIYLDGYTKKNLDFVKDKVLNGKDMFICVVDGRPGAGKSTLVSQLAFYLNPKTSNKNETFTLEQFEEALRTAKKGDVIILDESFEVLNKRTTQSRSNMVILSLLQQMRARQVFIFIILPYVFDLDKNIILGLCDLFFHCYRKDFGNRGRYAAYDRHRLKSLWLNCRQSYSYHLGVAKPNYRARFNSAFPLGSEEYEKKKTDALQQLTKDIEVEGNKYMLQRNQAIIKLKEFIPVSEIEKIIGVKRRQLFDIIKKYSKSKGVDKDE